MGSGDLMPTIRLKPIIPKGKIIDNKKLNRELINALDHTANIIDDDFDKTVKTWSKKPKFKKTGPRKRFGTLEVIISTRNEIYSYVEYGTKPHVITPKKRGGVLVFRSKYLPKTRTGVIGSRASRRSGDLVFTKRVVHPGIQARMFSKTIAKRRQKNLENLIRLAYLRSVT